MSFNESLHRKARRKVRAKKGFFIHLCTFVSVGLFFFFLNLATLEGSDWWFFFPLLPWGAGLLIHYLVLFGIPGTNILTERWEEEEYEKELERLEWLEYRKQKWQTIDTSFEESLPLKELEKQKPARRANYDDFV